MSLFFPHAHQCSAASYALVYCIIAEAIVVSSVGAYLWRRSQRKRALVYVEVK